MPYALVQWALCAAVKLALFPISALGVFFSVLGDGYIRTPKMWRWCADAQSTPKKTRWYVLYYWAIRNPVKVMEINHPKDYKQSGDIDESLPGFQWRYRNTRFLDSFRAVWGEPSIKGKKEFYVGWKIGSPSPCKFTLQLRPF